MNDRNAMDEVTLPEILRLLGEKEVEIYRLRRNEMVLKAKLDEIEEAKGEQNARKT